jgi:hypothetical protein
MNPYQQFLVAAGVVIGLIAIFFVVCIFCGFLASGEVAREEDAEEDRRSAERWAADCG